MLHILFLTPTMAPSGLLLILLYSLFHSLHLCRSTQFDVGDITGWIVPLPNNTNFYNHWASAKRFQIGDTIRFNYKKDSVMEVNKSDYTACKSNRPNYFSNIGHTVYSLNRSGLFYFISGTAGHCQMGQRMVVWVLEQDALGSGSHSSGSAPFLYQYPPMSILMFLAATFYY